MQPMQFLDQLTPYGDLLFSAAVILLVLVAAIYIATAHRILKQNRILVAEMRRQSDVLLRPYVDIRPVIDPVTLLIFLQIRNTGRMPARDLRLRLDRSFYQFGQKRDDRNLARFHAFTEALPGFTPGQEISFHLGTGASIFGEGRREDLTPPVFTVTARYGYEELEFAEETTVDLRALLMNAGMATPLKQELESINKNVHAAAEALQAMARAYSSDAPPPE